MENAANPADVGTSTRKLSVSENWLIGLRTLIDILLVCGSLFSFGYGLTIWGIKPSFENLYMVWAWGIFVSAGTILVSAVWSTGPLSRNIVRVCCSIYLLSLIFLFYLCAAHLELWENLPLRMLFVGCAAWAVVCIGLLCIEQRLLKNCSRTIAERKSTLAEKLVKLLSAVFAPAAVAVYIASMVTHGPHFIKEFGAVTWPRVAASVDDARTSTIPLHYGQKERLVIDYHFSVDDKTYHGSRIAAVGSQSHYSYVNINEKVEQLRLDKTILVAYDPGNPSRSMAFPCSLNFLLLSIWILLFYLAIGINSFAFLAQEHWKTLLSKTGKVDSYRWYSQAVVIGFLGAVGSILFVVFKCISLTFDPSGLILVLLSGAAYRIDRMLTKTKTIPQSV